MSYSDTYNIPSENKALGEKARVSDIKYKWLQDHVRQFERNPKLVSVDTTGPAEPLDRAGLVGGSALKGTDRAFETRDFNSSEFINPTEQQAELMGGRALRGTNKTLEGRGYDLDTFTSPADQAKQAEVERQDKIKQEQVRSAGVVRVLGEAIDYAREKHIEGHL